MRVVVRHKVARSSFVPHSISATSIAVVTLVPFNQGSNQDVETLVDYIYTMLGLGLDYIIPFAAVPENGREIDGLDDKSELAHHIMLETFCISLVLLRRRRRAAKSLPA